MKGSLKIILSHSAASLTIFFTLLWPQQTAWSSEPVELHTTVGEAPSLEVVLSNTLSKNAQIQEAAQDIEIARGQLEQAKAAVFPHASALLLSGPMPEIRGDPLHSDTNWSKWGPFVRAGIEIVEPIYSFGQLGSYRKAAENQIEARMSQTQMKRDEVIATAKELYYGYEMASDLEGLVDDTVKFLEEAATTAEDSMKSTKKTKSVVKPHDLYKLKTALEELRQMKLVAVAARQTAERAVAWISATPATSLTGRSLEAESFEKKTLEEYLKLARENRPEFRALHAGQEAYLALRDAKRAQSYPVLFVGGMGLVGYSPVADKQQSTFAYDPFNPLAGGVGIGLKFDLEFKRHAAEAQEQEAQANKLKATEAYAAPGIEVQVKKAYWELEQAIGSLEIADRRRLLGKKWFVSSAMGWSIGLTPAKDLLEALEGEALAKKNYIETVYSLNMSLAHLTQAVGVEVAQLKYK